LKGIPRDPLPLLLMSLLPLFAPLTAADLWPA